MGERRGIRQSVPCRPAAAVSLTARQAEVLQLAGRGLGAKQIARSLGISVRTVEDHFSAMRARTGARSQGELIAYWAATGLVKPGLAVLETIGYGTADDFRGRAPETSRETACRDAGTASEMIGAMIIAPAIDNSGRIGYERISTRAQDHQAQLDALAAAHCREVIVETARSRDARPQLRRALGMLRGGDTLVIYKLNRVARSMKELVVLLEDLQARGINLHILSGVCAGLHRPAGADITDKMLFLAAAMAAEMERDLLRERTLDGLGAARAQGRRGGRPAAVHDDILAVARARRERGESVTVIARHLGIGRSTLYRALNLGQDRPGSLSSEDTTQ